MTTPVFLRQKHTPKTTFVGALFGVFVLSLVQAVALMFSVGIFHATPFVYIGERGVTFPALGYLNCFTLVIATRLAYIALGRDKKD